MNDYDQLYAAFEAAFEGAIRTLGLEALKRTSMFGSNDRPVEMLIAA